MYVQPSFGETDPEKLLALAARYPFATVITPGVGELWVSHVPLLVQRRGGALVLAGHLARANAHWEAMEGERSHDGDLPRTARLHLADLVRDLASGSHLELRGGPRGRKDARPSRRA